MPGKPRGVQNLGRLKSTLRKDPEFFINFMREPDQLEELVRKIPQEIRPVKKTAKFPGKNVPTSGTLPLGRMKLPVKTEKLSKKKPHGIGSPGEKFPQKF